MGKKYHLLMGKRVPVDEYDTDKLTRLMWHITKRCNKFALKHTKSIDNDDKGVWVARGFVKTKRNNSGGKWELSVIGDSPIESAEKLLTVLAEHEEKYGTSKPELEVKDHPTTNNNKER